MMKSIILFFWLAFSIVIASCNNNANINQLQDEVLNDIKANIESQGEDIEVKSFVLTHLSGNEYVGILETIENGQVFKYNVNVVSDGNTFVWEIPASELSQQGVEEYSNEDSYSDESYQEAESYQDESYPEEEKENMIDAMEKINDPTYCSLCKGTGVEKNTAKEIFGGPDGRICPMCEGTGKRSY